LERLLEQDNTPRVPWCKPTQKGMGHFERSLFRSGALQFHYIPLGSEWLSRLWLWRTTDFIIHSCIYHPQLCCFWTSQISMKQQHIVLKASHDPLPHTQEEVRKFSILTIKDGSSYFFSAIFFW